ncbi:MAG: peptidoglycan -binding protein, partial [Pseudomonadota bacterium]|nr:peptidoglycan -binding protein [Pseudomonadota bacterium]
EAQLQAARDQLALAEQGASDRDAAVAQLQADLAAAQARASTLQAQLSDAEETRGGLAAQLAQAEAGQAELQARLDAALAASDGAEALRQDKAALEASMADLRARLTAALAAQNAAQADQVDRDDLRDQLAAALAAKLRAEQAAETTLSEAEQRAALLAQARSNLAEEQEQSAEAARRTALLNQQVAQLRTQLGSLQSLLDDYKARDAANQVQIQSLGTDLNAALAQKAAEERRRRELEEAERKRLEAERDQLEKYRSEFFGQLRDVFAGQAGVQIVGDRFVFSSEVLFAPGSADLSQAGQQQIAGIAATLRSLAAEIPQGIDWMLRVDGHTDDVPLSGLGEFRDNWELSQARALSVVRYMVDFLGFPPDRLSANGFAEFQPIAQGTSEEARAANRRIELKFTER